MPEGQFLLRGEVDMARVPELRAALDRAIALSDADLVVDCSELTFIDSSGIGLLIEATKNLDRKGRTLRVTNLEPFGVHLMEVLGVSDLLRVNQPSFDTTEEQEDEHYD